jgi:hypothetical protein
MVDFIAANTSVPAIRGVATALLRSVTSTVKALVPEIPRS